MPIKIDYIPSCAPPYMAKAFKAGIEHPDTITFLSESPGGYDVTVSVSWGEMCEAISFEVPIVEAVDLWLDTASPDEAKKAAAWFRQIANLIHGE